MTMPFVWESPPSMRVTPSPDATGHRDEKPRPDAKLHRSGESGTSAAYAVSGIVARPHATRTVHEAPREGLGIEPERRVEHQATRASRRQSERFADAPEREWGLVPP